MTDGNKNAEIDPKRGVLDQILNAKGEEIALLKKTPASRSAGGARSRGDLVIERLTRRAHKKGASAETASAETGLLPLHLITEIKRRSPSAGALSTALSVSDRALLYARGGASMISVLCDGPFFDGAWDHVTSARAALDAVGLAVPILAKEFILDERQLEEAAARGADSALLIVRILEDRDGAAAPTTTATTTRLATLVARSRALGLEPLVEVVTEEELRRALDADAKVIGVNARDLDTLSMDPLRPAKVLAAIPKDRIALHLSGLKTADDVMAVAKSAVDGVLIGEALMRLDDPSTLLAQMVDAARSS